LFHHAMGGAFGGDGQAVKLAGEADGEVADVDHFLDLAKGFLVDFADLESDQFRKCGFALAKFYSKSSHQFAALGSGDETPLQERFMSGLSGAIDVGGSSARNRGQG